MNFGEYYKFIKESPDTFIYDIDGKIINLNWQSKSARPFGFINRQLKFKMRGKLHDYFKNVKIRERLVVGDIAKSHFDMLKDYIKSLKEGSITILHGYDEYTTLDLSDDKFKERVINDPEYNFIVNSHEFFSPCGRIWLYPEPNNYTEVIISFWGSKIKIETDHIKDVLERFDIPNNLHDDVIIELPYEDDNILTFKEFKDNIKNINVKKSKQVQEFSHLAAGFGGAFKRKEGSGSISQGNRARKSGYDTFAKYRNDRFFSEQSH